MAIGFSDAMTALPFPEWKPDLMPAAASQTIQNVIPRADGYGPFKNFNAMTSALPAACRGYFCARNTDGSVTIFAGTSTRLYKLNNTNLTWVPVSKVTALTSISNASPAIFTKAGHGLAAGDALQLTTTDTLPTGLSTGTVYYVISAGLTADEFEVSTSPGGAAVNTSSAGSGTHSMTYFYTTLSSGMHWQFAQFGSIIIAVQGNTVPQAFTLASSAAFADLSGSPPQASYVAIVGRFVVLSGLASTPFRVQWSGLGAATTWTAGTNSSDSQDLPDGGIVRGVAGGEYGVIFQETTIRRMIFIGGSLVFQIERVTEDEGLLAPYSIARAGDKVFFLSQHGFHVISGGNPTVPIGKEIFDRTFFNEVDFGSIHLVIGAADPNGTRVFWAYKRESSSNPALWDRIIVYDYAIQRAAYISGLTGEYIAGAAAPGLTLEGLDSVSSSIDALAGSLDDISTATLSNLSGVNSSHVVGFYTGDNLEATLDTSEQSGPRRIRVQGFRPSTDAGTCYGSIGSRETEQAAVTYSTEQAVDSRGLVPANVSTRLARGRLRIPAATTWTYANGVDPQFAIEGSR